jgi:hypothetical protein
MLAAVNITNFSSDPQCQGALTQSEAAKALIAVLRTGSSDVQRVALQVQPLAAEVHPTYLSVCLHL